MTSATDALRALLDERGVEWWPMHDDEVGYREDRDTEFLVYGCKHVAHEWGCRLQVDMLTPEQAIAATLGPGTCRFEQIPEALYDDIECSECGVALWGFQMDIEGEGCPTRPRYCPNCGRKVVG